MRKTLNILFFLLISSVLQAQTPVIDHLEVDEVKQQLKIFGTISSLTGEVTIDDTLVNVVSWSDSMVIVVLPDSGRGSGGDVIIKDINGVSNKRTLSVFQAVIWNTLFYYYNNPDVGGYQPVDYRVWHVVWRADISARKSQSDSVVKYEISRKSYGGRWGNAFAEFRLQWVDTSSVIDSSISLSGTINLAQGNILFDSAVMTSTIQSPYLRTVKYLPQPIKFDSTGFLTGYTDKQYCPSPSGQDLCRDNRLYNQQLLFPPSPKSAVKNVKLINEIVSANFEVIDKKVKIVLSAPEQTNAVISLVDILGRKVSTLYTGMLDEDTELLTDANIGRGQVMFLEVAIKGIKRYFKLPFVF